MGDMGEEKRSAGERSVKLRSYDIHTEPYKNILTVELVITSRFGLTPAEYEPLLAKIREIKDLPIA